MNLHAHCHASILGTLVAMFWSLKSQIRLLTLAAFVQLHDLGCFEVEAIEDFDALGMEKEVIHLHRITMKKPS